jgi:transcriptional regulator with XRE-family HTH domain
MSKTATKSSPKARVSSARASTSRASSAEPDLEADELDDEELDDEPAPAPEPLRAPAKPIRSEGQRMLLDVPGSLSQIGKAVGASKQSIAQWRDGLYVPDDRYRRALASHFGIPFSAWGAAEEPEPELELDDDTDDEELEGTASALRDYERLIKLLRTQLKNGKLTPRERAQLTDAFSRALTQKTRLERDREMLEDRTIRDHPKWQRLKKAIIEALLPHPAAARDVEAAVQRILGEDGDAE